MTQDEEIKRYGESIPEHIRPFLPDEPLPLTRAEIKRGRELCSYLVEKYDTSLE